MKFGKIFITSLFLLSTFTITAQKGVEDGSKYGHGEDSIRCLKNLSLYRQYRKMKMFKDALPFWRIVAKECPRSSKNIFIDGPVIYQHLIENTEDKEKKQAYVDTLMQVYDMRIKYYPDEKGYILGRKAVDLFKYDNQNIESVKKVYEMLKKSTQLEGAKSSPAALLAYMNASCMLFQNDKLSRTEVINTYSEINDIIDQKLEKRKSRLTENAKKHIDKIFTDCNVADCESLDDIFGKKLNNNPEDIKLLRNIYKLFSANNCTGSEVYYKAFEKLVKYDSTPDLIIEFAELAKSNGDYEKASSYYKKAIEQQDDKEEKAAYYLKLADMTFRNMDKLAEARKYARQAYELDESSGKALMLIGYIYGSTKNCTNKELNKKAVYWLAVDYFAKAKKVDPSLEEEANDAISTYSKYFPDKKEIFFNGLEIGQPYTVNCWINESTTVRASD